MPEPDANLLRPEQLQQVLDWIKTRWTHPQACPIDGSTSWEVPTQMAAIPVLTPARVFELGRSFPVVPVSCASCGYTVLINAVKIGLVPSIEAIQASSVAEESSDA